MREELIDAVDEVAKISAMAGMSICLQQGISLAHETIGLVMSAAGSGAISQKIHDLRKRSHVEEDEVQEFVQAVEKATQERVSEAWGRLSALSGMPFRAGVGEA